MRSTTIFKSLAFVAAANAVEFTNTEYDIHALTPFNITWTGNISPVTIFLMNGPPSDLQTVNTIVSGAQGTSFVWLPSISLPDELYTLQIDDDGISDPNFSPQFQFQGGAANPSSTSTSSSGSATETSSTSGTTSGTALPTITSSGVSNSTVTTGSTSTKTTKTASSTTTSGTGSSTSAVQSGAITGNGAAYLASPTGLMMLAGGALALLA